MCLTTDITQMISIWFLKTFTFVNILTPSYLVKNMILRKYTLILHQCRLIQKKTSRGLMNAKQ